jgi:hypothetical protein
MDLTASPRQLSRGEVDAFIYAEPERSRSQAQQWLAEFPRQELGDPAAR